MVRSHKRKGKREFNVDVSSNFVDKGKGRYRENKEDELTKTEKKSSLDMETLMQNNPFFEHIGPCKYRIKMGYVPNMRVDGIFYANEILAKELLEEVVAAEQGSSRGGGFLPALRQVANVAGLPGIVGHSLAMPDAHSGYGFSIGNVAAVDMSDPEAVVSPGGVGFDINCGVRLLRTNLTEEEVRPSLKRLAEELFKEIPVGVGSRGVLELSEPELDQLMRHGMQWLVDKGYAWPEDLDCCEERGCMTIADPACVSSRAKNRGLQQAGSLGSGNHYMEIQVVEEVFDEEAARAMGLRQGTVCVMIHSGSRGLGHQVCTDFLEGMQKAVSRDPELKLNDRQLACCRLTSELGQNYLKAMAAAANFAWCNRAIMAYSAREVFARVMQKEARELDMHLVYDVAHNIAKIEDHRVDGKMKKLLVHRKGATRSFGPNHPQIPNKYKPVGQPVVIGGSMGTNSYVLVGTETAMQETFGSTCHGAGRQMSRSQAIRSLSSGAVLKDLAEHGIVVRVATPKLIAEEASEAYKDVSQVIQSCHEAGISKKVAKLRPLAVIKG